jgi:hypothetical protein
MTAFCQNPLTILPRMAYLITSRASRLSRVGDWVRALFGVESEDT